MSMEKLRNKGVKKLRKRCGARNFSISRFSNFSVFHSGFTPLEIGRGRKNIQKAGVLSIRPPVSSSLFSFVTRLPSLTGFTLLETIVALAVILTAMAGPISLATRGIFSAKFARSRLLSANLAQEGIELVRKIRDDNILVDREWDTGIGIGDWQIDVLSSDFSPFVSAKLLRDSDTGLYNYTTGAETLFIRRVSITKPGTDQITVVSHVTWTEGGVPREMTLRETLYNWR